MRLRPLVTALVACGVAVAAFGGVSYATGLLPFTSHAAPADAAPKATTRVVTPAAQNHTATTPSPTPAATRTSTPAPDPTPTPKPTHNKTAKPKPAAVMELNDRSTQVRELEARLVRAGLLQATWVDGYFGTATRQAVRSFQARHGLDQLGYVDANTWQRIRSATRTPTHAELYPPKPKQPKQGGKLDSRCLTGRAICIDKSTRSLRWVIDGTVRLTMDVRFGCPSSPTREGTFRVNSKVLHGYSRMYDSAMPFSMFFSGDEAVHYSSDFAARGYAGCSHGCVNVRNYNAIQQLFNEARVGDKVIVYWS